MKEIYLVANAYDHVSIVGNHKISAPAGVKIFYAYETKEEAKKHARQLKAKIITLKTDKFSSEKNN